MDKDSNIEMLLITLTFEGKIILNERVFHVEDSVFTSTLLEKIILRN